MSFFPIPMIFKKGFALHLLNDKTPLSQVLLWLLRNNFCSGLWQRTSLYPGWCWGPNPANFSRCIPCSTQQQSYHFQGTIYATAVNAMQVLRLETIKIINLFQQRLSLIRQVPSKICLSLIKASATVTLLLINNTPGPDKLFSLKVVWFFPSHQTVKEHFFSTLPTLFSCSSLCRSVID